MILAGDIGGTKTVLALYTQEQGVRKPLREERFPSREFESLDAILRKFLDDTGARPAAASFGVAGPIIDQKCRVTNLPWMIDAAALARDFDIPTVHLLNDLQAVATAVPHLEKDEVCVLNEGAPDPTGNIGVIAPGTGLGEAFLTPEGDRYRAWATEGGHASFAPVTLEQLELLAFLERRFGHVSFERVCSGSGFPNIYDYLVASGSYEEPEWLRKELAEAKDPTPIIMEAGYQRKAPICIAALDLFVHILGGVLGNMALRVMATGGLYLGGGVPPRILSRLQKRDFLDAICYKGRFREWISRIPVYVILDSKSAIRGAAWDALDADGGQGDP
jgi:glucokinase